MSPIQRVYKKILSTYPFLNAKEKRSFISGAERFLDVYPNVKDLKDKFALVRGVLFLLKNGHADFREFSPRKRFDRKTKPLFKPKIKLEKKQRILRLSIPTWHREMNGVQNTLIRACKKYRGSYDAVLIDVRENSGGSSRIAHDFAAIFFNKSILYGIFLRGGRGSKLKRIKGILNPHKSLYIGVPVAILISKKCFSSNELFLAPFYVSGRATLIGEQTRGGSANPLSLKIKIDGAQMIARIPRWRFFLKGGKQPIEKTKIRPNLRYTKPDIVKFAERRLRGALQNRS